MSTKHIRMDREGGVATLTLCRPDLLNAITPKWIEELYAHAETLHCDASLRCVLVQSEGSMFCVGADVKAMSDHLEDLHEYIQSLIEPAHAALLRLSSLPVPIVGLLRGTAAGGGASLALACDILVAARSSRIVFAYPQLGTTPDFGLSHALISRLGTTRALQLFLLSDAIQMEEAEKIGLVQRVVEDDEAVAAAQATVKRLLSIPSSAAKALFRRGNVVELQERLDHELHSFVSCSDTKEFRDRVEKFAKGQRG